MPSGDGVAAQFAELLEQRGVGRARQQRRQQRIFLRARGIDLVDVAGRVGAEQIGPQDRAVDAGGGFDGEHALRRDAIPIRNRRLRNSDAARELAHAADGADRFLQSGVSHRVCSKSVQPDSNKNGSKA